MEIKLSNWFKVRKAAQIAAFFTKKANGNINVLKLVKLIYLADRSFMTKYDSPMLNDFLVSMPHGPVNSMTLSYIDGMQEDRGDWKEFITDRAMHDVGLTRNNLSIDDLDELSEADIEVLDGIWTKFGHMDQYQLRNYTHKHCPEWENPHGSSTPIPYERIFKYLSKENSEELADKVHTNRILDNIFSDA